MEQENNYIADPKEIVIDLRELIVYMLKRCYLIILFLLVFAIGGYEYTERMVIPQYEATATMIINSRQEITLTLTSDQIASAQKLVDTYAVIVKSDTVLNQVIEQLDLNMTYEELAGKTTVTSVNGTQIMKVSVRHPDPKIAYEIVKKITEIAPAILVDVVEAGSCKVVSNAKATQSPVTPNLKKNVMMAAMGGAALAVMILVFAFMMKEKRIGGEQDVKDYLGIPVLGTIPDVKI